MSSQRRLLPSKKGTPREHAAIPHDEDAPRKHPGYPSPEQWDAQSRPVVVSGRARGRAESAGADPPKGSLSMDKKMMAPDEIGQEPMDGTDPESVPAKAKPNKNLHEALGQHMMKMLAMMHKIKGQKGLLK